MNGVGEEFARAVAAKDQARLRELLGRGGQLPRDDAQPLLGGSGRDDVVEALEHAETDTFADRERVGYRFRVRNANGLHAVEEQA